MRRIIRDAGEALGALAALLANLEPSSSGLCLTPPRSTVDTSPISLTGTVWMGSYTCNQPGYFTTIAGNEGKPVDNVFFAGEHTDSFYCWQGFMEGAAISGLTAAGDLVASL